MGRGGKQAKHSPSGPGFESQVPHFLNNFGFQIFQYMCISAAYHAPSSIQAPDGQEPDLVANDWRSTKSQVHAPTLDNKKSKGPASNGPRNSFLHLLKSGPTPLFLFILFNCLFHLFNFLTNHKILFF